MRSKDIINQYINKNYYLKLILVLIYISYSESIIEIPLKPIRVKGIPKFGNIAVVEPIKDDSEDKQLNNRFLNEEGNALINDNLLFVANIRIGSNKQQFNLILDTGSYIVWVAQKGSADNQYINNHYDPWASNTAKNTNIPFQQTYITGSCSGTYYSDNFNYVNNRDFQMFFGVATKTEFPITGGDGIIGLGHLYSDEKLSFIKMLNVGGVTNSLLFSFKFGNDINVGTNGKLYLGKHEDFSKNNVATCPIVNGRNNPYWGCEVNAFGMKMSEKEVKTNRRFNFIFDTGTNAIFLPLEFQNDLQNQIQQFNCLFVATQDQTAYELVCQNLNNLPDLTFEINGNQLILPSHYLFYRVYQYAYSRVYFAKMEFYIIGSPFFFAFHTLFDKESEKLHFYPENNENLIKRNYLDLDMEEEKIEKTDKFFDKYNILNLCIIIGLILLSIGSGLLIYYVIKNRKKDNKKEIIVPSNNYENTLL